MLGREEICAARQESAGATNYTSDQLALDDAEYIQTSCCRDGCGIVLQSQSVCGRLDGRNSSGTG